MACKEKYVAEKLEDLRINESESSDEETDDDLFESSVSDSDEETDDDLFEWDKTDFKKKMENLPVFARGPKIFEIWKKTLLFWLSFRRHLVFLVTPFLDEDILKEFLDIVKTKKKTAKLGWFFVREECHETWVIENGKKTKKIVPFKEIWENSTRHYDKEDKKFFDEKVFPQFIAIKKETNYFHGKLIGCVNRKTDEAEVLQTSANFNETHFRKWKNGKCNHESLGYHRMSKKKFKKNLLRPMEKLQKNT